MGSFPFKIIATFKDSWGTANQLGSTIVTAQNLTFGPFFLKEKGEPKIFRTQIGGLKKK